MSKIRFGLGAVLAIVVGCGGGGSGFKPGVQGSKPLGELTPAEAKTLCESTTAHFRAQLASSSGREADCRVVGALVAANGAATAPNDVQVQLLCTAGYSICLQTLADGGVPTAGGDGGTADPCASSTGVPACTATVDQYTACINETEASLAKYPTCNQLTAAKLAELMAAPGGVLGGVTNGPACQAFTAACPGATIPTGLPIPPLGP
jgi:hypothetical protein